MPFETVSSAGHACWTVLALHPPQKQVKIFSPVSAIRKNLSAIARVSDQHKTQKSFSTRNLTPVDDQRLIAFYIRLRDTWPDSQAATSEEDDYTSEIAEVSCNGLTITSTRLRGNMGQDLPSLPTTIHPNASGVLCLALMESLSRLRGNISRESKGYLFMNEDAGLLRRKLFLELSRSKMLSEKYERRVHN